MITAIQTAYKGYHFRSRLEARWAVFFDALGISWEYEPEGFELPDGSRYLPDFRIKPGPGVPYLWVEIKPIVPMTASEEAKVFAFAMEVTREKNTGLIALRGAPSVSDGAFLFGNFDGTKKLGPISAATFHELLLASAWRVGAAATKARSARFEHGQKGATL
jgi:hypothetical protein